MYRLTDPAKSYLIKAKGRGCLAVLLEKRSRYFVTYRCGKRLLFVKKFVKAEKGEDFLSDRAAVGVIGPDFLWYSDAKAHMEKISSVPYNFIS